MACVLAAARARSLRLAPAALRAGLASQGAASGGANGSGGGQVVVVTSGKGGVGKTTTAASFAYGLAERGHRTVAIDFDIGLRNLDLHLGCERRVVFDFVNLIREECGLRQALIKDRHNKNLFLLAASQTRDKSALTESGVGRVIEELRDQFDYIVCDSPAGIESGAFHAMYFADKAIVCTNPEISSVRDSDKMIGILNSKSKRAMEGRAPIVSKLLVTRYVANRVQGEEMLSVPDIEEMLGVEIIGVIPESEAVLRCSNIGRPVIADPEESTAALAYRDFVARFLGERLDMRFLEPEQKGFLERLFGKK